MNQYKCYICGYWTWAKSLPANFINENTHSTCARRLRDFEVYTRPIARKVEREIEQAQQQAEPSDNRLY